VRFYKTPDSVLRAQLAAYDKAVAKQAAENPMMKEILESQKRFAERVVKWDLDTNVSRRMAYDNYFRAKAAGKSA
jgi:TRAP-type mannitol/chloroaromatic compound transport system substrate-binding protein